MDAIELLQILVLGLTFGGVYTLMASGLTLIFGVMKIVNLAHPAFIVAAAYISYVLFHEFAIDPMLSIAVNMAIMFVAGMLVYTLILRRGAAGPRYTETTVLATFAIALIVEGTLGTIFTNTNRSVNPRYATQVFFVGDVFIPRGQLYAFGISIALMVGLVLLLKYTRLGYAIRATAQNRSAAQTVGVNVDRTSMLAFGIGTALAGASGSLLSFMYSFTPGTHWDWVSILLALVVLGGLGKLAGAVVGAVLLAVVAGFVSSFIGPTWQPLTFYLSLFIVLLVRPQGIFGERQELT
jgi:branched-chain amino acid transport system permease protein